MDKQQLPLSSLPTATKRRPSLFTYILLLALSALGFQLAQFAPHLSFSHCSERKSNETLHWKPCGYGMQCSKLSVPLNWENQTDERRVELSILKRPASKQKEKLGSLYMCVGISLGCYCSAALYCSPLQQPRWTWRLRQLHRIGGLVL